MCGFRRFAHRVGNFVDVGEAPGRLGDLIRIPGGPALVVVRVVISASPRFVACGGCAESFDYWLHADFFVLSVTCLGSSWLVNRIRLPNSRCSTRCRALVSVRQDSRSSAGVSRSGVAVRMSVTQRGLQMAAIWASTFPRGRRVRPPARRAASSASWRRGGGQGLVQHSASVFVSQPTQLGATNVQITESRLQANSSAPNLLVLRASAHHTLLVLRASAHHSALRTIFFSDFRAESSSSSRRSASSCSRSWSRP
jgi:hypothetical protein